MTTNCGCHVSFAAIGLFKLRRREFPREETSGSLHVLRTLHEGTADRVDGLGHADEPIDEVLPVLRDPVVGGIGLLDEVPQLELSEVGTELRPVAERGQIIERQCPVGTGWLEQCGAGDKISPFNTSVPISALHSQ